MERDFVFTDLGLKDFHCCSHASGAWKTQTMSSGVLWAVQFCFVLKLFVLFLFRAISVCRGFCVVIFLFSQTVGGIKYLPLCKRHRFLMGQVSPCSLLGQLSACNSKSLQLGPRNSPCFNSCLFLAPEFMAEILKHMQEQENTLPILASVS